MSGTERRRRGAPCPICGNGATARFKPFCSKRCADVDLHRWLGEGYRIPTEEPPEGLDEAAFGSGRDHDDYG